MLLKEIVEKRRYAFFDEAADWRDAVRKSCLPLIETGCVKQDYPEDIIRCIDELGPYIVIVPGIAIPHSVKGSQNVNSTAISFARFEKPVAFAENDPEKEATLFFALSAVDEEEHLKNMRQLFLILSDDELVSELLAADSAEKLAKLDSMLEE